MNAPNNLPSGFKPLEEPTQPARLEVQIMRPEAWEKGGRAYYRGVRKLSEDDGKKSTAHLFSASADGELYGVWDCASLRSKLSLVRVGEPIFLRYLGTIPNPQFNDGYLHKWEVAVQEGASQAAPPRQALATLPDAFSA